MPGIPPVDMPKCDPTIAALKKRMGLPAPPGCDGALPEVPTAVSSDDESGSPEIPDGELPTPPGGGLPLPIPPGGGLPGGARSSLQYLSQEVRRLRAGRTTMKR